LTRNELLQRLQAIKDLGNFAVLNSSGFFACEHGDAFTSLRLQITIPFFMSALTLESDAILPVAR
jgi:hypothetical protein